MKAKTKDLILDCKQSEDENIILIACPDGEERRFHKPLFDQLFDIVDSKPESKKDKKEQI
jgi:hypothetical protein